MPDLHSTLTLKLTDDVSAPAGKIAASMKGLGVSAEQLEKASKLDSIRNAQASFRQAATTFQTTQQKLRALALEFSAAETPTKKMTAALAKAHEQAAAARGVFQQQSAAFKQARIDMQQLNVPLSQVATEEERLRQVTLSATQAMEQQATRAQTLGARLRSGFGNIARTIAPLLGPPILAGTYEAIKEGAKHESSKLSLMAAGIPESDVEHALDIAMEQQAKYPGLKITDILERYKEGRALALNKEDAIKNLPVISQASAAMSALEKGGKVAAGSSTGLGLVLTGAENLGLSTNPARLKAYLDSYIKGRQVFGDMLSPEQVYGFAKGAKGSSSRLSDRFLFSTAMSLTSELGGKQAGTGVDAVIKQITGNFRGQNDVAKEYRRLGLLNAGDFEVHKGGKLGDLRKGHHVQGWELMQTDPDKWVAEILMPAMKQHGVTSAADQEALIEKMFPGRGASVMSKMVTQAELFKEHARQQRDAMGLGASGLYTKDPILALDALKESIRDFGAVVASPMMETAAHGMAHLARTAAEWSKSIKDLQKEYPTSAKVAAEAITGVGLGGGLLLTSALVRSLVGGFGLKGSALALDGSAAALSRAAIALGGSGVIPGGKTPMVVGPDGKPPGGGPGFFDFIKPLLLYDTYKYGNELMKPLFNMLPHPAYPKGYDPDKKLDESIGDRAQNVWGDITSGAKGAGLRFQAPAWTPGSESGAMPSISAPPIEDRQGDARAAGQSFGKAFRDGAVEELQHTIADVEAAVKSILNMLNFSSSPDLRPQGAGVISGSASGNAGASVRGSFTDYGINP